MYIFITTGVVLILIAIVSEFQANWYKENKPIYWWWHPLWVVPFLILPIVAYLLHHDIWMAIMILIPRILFFSPILNLFRKLPFFYLHGDTQYGSWWDKQLLKIGIWYPLGWIVLTLAYLIILFV